MSSKIKIKIQEIGTEYLGLVDLYCLGYSSYGMFCMTVKWPNPGLFYSDFGRLL